MSSFSVGKEIIENDNSWVVISLSNLSKNEFVQTFMCRDSKFGNMASHFPDFDQN